MKLPCFKLYRAYSISFNIFIKSWQFFLELNFKRFFWSSEKEEESCCLVCMFTSSTKHEIRHFQVMVQWWQRNVQKHVIHGQSCCFANLNLLHLCHSCWRGHHHCLSSVYIVLCTQLLIRTQRVYMSSTWR